MELTDLVRGRSLTVRQTREWREVLGFETRNRYELLAEDGRLLGRAAEERRGFGAWVGRQLFGRCRAATLHLYDPDGRELGRVEKPFRWWFQRVDLYEGDRRVGGVERRFAVLERRFEVEDPSGRGLLAVVSPLFRPWTFRLLLGGHEVGRIAKQWRGLFQEWLTDADTFGVEFTEPTLDAEVRKLLLAATFLVDFACFEENQRR